MRAQNTDSLLQTIDALCDLVDMRAVDIRVLRDQLTDKRTAIDLLNFQLDRAKEVLKSTEGQCAHFMQGAMHLDAALRGRRNETLEEAAEVARAHCPGCGAVTPDSCRIAEAILERKDKDNGREKSGCEVQDM